MKRLVLGTIFVTCFYSALSWLSVRHDLAMSGYYTRAGQVYINEVTKKDTVISVANGKYREVYTVTSQGGNEIAVGKVEYDLAKVGEPLIVNIKYVSLGQVELFVIEMAHICVHLVLPLFIKCSVVVLLLLLCLLYADWHVGDRRYKTFTKYLTDGLVKLKGKSNDTL